jgi:hypothetical protein
MATESPINRPYKAPGPGGVGGAGLSPGARSNPSRGDTSHEGAMPTVPKDQGEKPEPSAQPTAKTDSIRSAIDQHLHRHAVLRLGRDDLPPSPDGLIMPLRDDQIDLSSGLPLPTLDEDQEVTESDLVHGRRLREEYVEAQAARAKQASWPSFPCKC